MLARLIHKLHQWANGRNILIVLLLFILFNMIVLPPVLSHIESISHGVGLVDMLNSYTPDTLYTHLGNFDLPAQQFYMLHELTLDILYPLVSALLFSFAIAYLLKRTLPAANAIQYLALVPFSAMLVDYLENACIVTTLALYPTRVDVVAQAANLFTVCKWVLSYLELLLLIGSLVAFLIRKVYELAATNKTQRKETSKHGI
jgi:hypothetical protein